MMVKKANQAERIGFEHLNIPLSRTQKEKVRAMAAEDERTMTDFARRLIEQEWRRREAARPAN